METLFKVPIRNLFCLLSYVNEMPELSDSLNDVDEDIITYDFIAKRFLDEVHVLYQRGLVRNYVAVTKSTDRLGGRILVNESMPFLISRQPMMVCEKDYYSTDIQLNQILKSTLNSIRLNRHVKEETRKRSFSYLEYIPDVNIIPLSRGIFSRITFGRHNVFYKRMVNIARLIHELTLLSHKHGNWSLFSAKLDETSLNQIFEKFLFHFYRLEQKDYRVASEMMQWNLEGNSLLLPSMKTDVSLTKKKGLQKIVMDAKFYKNIFQVNYGKDSFHSHNLYQLFTYLMHQPKDMKLRGILIYPYNGVEVDEKFQWDDRITMEILTLNLEDSWQVIYSKLIGIL